MGLTRLPKGNRWYSSQLGAIVNKAIVGFGTCLVELLQKGSSKGAFRSWFVPCTPRYVFHLLWR